MNYIFLDLEWQTVYSKEHKCFVNEILEFGAVKYSENFEYTNKFQLYVKSELSKVVTKLCTEMTGITSEIMQNGTSFKNACNEFTSWCGENYIILTWSNSDIHALLKNYEVYINKKEINFLIDYIDLQKYVHQSVSIDYKQQISLANAAAMFNIDITQYVAHSAVDDSEVCALIFKQCYDKNLLNKVTQKADEEFYKRLMYRPFFINDINNLAVDKEQMVFKCLKCRNHIKRIGKWKFSNNNFAANFICRNCGDEYTGFISFKQNYDNVFVKKIIKQKPKPDQLPEPVPETDAGTCDKP